ncbi:MAG: Smr/MutS family protein [Pseudomonadota bacterium]
MRRSRRPLAPDDAALWSEVASTVRPMPRKPRAPLDMPVSAGQKPAPVTAPPVQDRLAPFEISARAPKEPRVTIAAQKDPVLRMDARVYVRMRRGRLSPEARIDLHGMTVAEAHSALTGFVLHAHGAGLRLVLVITGKGKSGAGGGLSRGGVLRHQVPHWLHLPPLGPRVLQVAEAHLSHGGAGALYVYLRRGG